MLIILSLKDIGVSNLRCILEVIHFAAKPETLVRGFQACGLYPLDANVVDTTNTLVKIQPGLQMKRLVGKTLLLYKVMKILPWAMPHL